MVIDDSAGFSDYESSRSSDGSVYSGQANDYGAFTDHELWLACKMNDIETDGANGVPRERDELIGDLNDLAASEEGDVAADVGADNGYGEAEDDDGVDNAGGEAPVLPIAVGVVDGVASDSDTTQVGDGFNSDSDATQTAESSLTADLGSEENGELSVMDL